MNDNLTTNASNEAESPAFLVGAVMGSWVATSERLPEIPKDAPSYAQHVKVIACWGNRAENVAQMDYCRRIVRGKEVYRFEWMGRISPWKVDYWMEFPKPPNYL